MAFNSPSPPPEASWSAPAPPPPEASWTAPAPPPPSSFASFSSSSDDDFRPHHRIAGAPAGFEGGWRSMLKPRKKHKVVDPGNGIMDLVQTPKTYSAWKPGDADSSSPAPANAALLA